MRGAVSGRHPYQFLSRLPTDRPDGSTRAAFGLRARRFTAARLGADLRTHPCDCRRVGYPRPERVVSRGTHRRADTVWSEGPALRGTWPRIRRVSAIRIALGR